MSTWREISVDVLNSLHLDPRNVRLDLSESAPEADIIQDLFHNEKAFALVESICKVGLLTHELPIVIKREGQLVVVEGNRRVAALKAIQNPFLVPEYQARLEKLTSVLADRDALRKVTVKLAPSQDEADQLIAAIHTGNQRVGWSPARQAAFFQAQIDAGKSPAYLISHYPTVDVKKFVIRSQILDLFRGVVYEDPQLKDFISARSFPVSILARLYSNEAFLSLAQIEVNEAHAQVRLKSSTNRFARLAEKIVGDIKEKRINTRVLNSARSDSYTGYMDQLRDLLGTLADDEDDSSEASASDARILVPSSSAQADGKKPKNNSTVDNRQSSTHNADNANNSGQASKPKPKATRYLNAETIQISAQFPPAIHKIHAELCYLDIKKFPNAAMDLLRTFLEKSIKAYAACVNEEIRRSTTESNGGVQSNGFIQLGHCLNWLEDHLKKDSKKRAFVQVVAKVRGNKLGGYIPTVDHMNAINHNHQVFATADDVRDCWDCMEGLMRMMLKP